MPILLVVLAAGYFTLVFFGGIAQYELLGLAVLYVVWTICKAVKGWIDRRKEFDILLDECRAEWRRRHSPRQRKV